MRRARGRNPAIRPKHTCTWVRIPGYKKNNPQILTFISVPGGTRLTCPGCEWAHREEKLERIALRAQDINLEEYLLRPEETVKNLNKRVRALGGEAFVLHFSETDRRMYSTVPFAGTTSLPSDARARMQYLEELAAAIPLKFKRRGVTFTQNWPKLETPEPSHVKLGEHIDADFDLRAALERAGIAYRRMNALRQGSGVVPIEYGEIPDELASDPVKLAWALRSLGLEHVGQSYYDAVAAHLAGKVVHSAA